MKCFRKAITDEQKRTAAEHAKTCIAKVGVSKEAVLKVMGGDFTVKDEKVEVRIVESFMLKNMKIKIYASCSALLNAFLKNLDS